MIHFAMTPPEINGKQLSDQHEKSMIKEAVDRLYKPPAKELIADPEAIKLALKQARYKRTVRIKQHVLP